MNALTNFDPDLPLGYDAILVQHAEAIRVLGKRVVGDIIEIGQRLTDAKARCGHGNWLPWLEREFGWSEDTTLRFMQVAELSKNRTVRDLEIPVSGLYLLAAPSTPEAARDEVVERAEAGERMTAAQIKEVVDKAVAAEIKTKLKACEAELRSEYEGAGQAKIDKAVAKLTAPLQKQIDKYEAKLAKIADREEARKHREANGSAGESEATTKPPRAATEAMAGTVASTLKPKPIKSSTALDEIKQFCKQWVPLFNKSDRRKAVTFLQEIFDDAEADLDEYGRKRYGAKKKEALNTLTDTTEPVE